MGRQKPQCTQSSISSCSGRRIVSKLAIRGRRRTCRGRSSPLGRSAASACAPARPGRCPRRPARRAPRAARRAPRRETRDSSRRRSLIRSGASVIHESPSAARPTSDAAHVLHRGDRCVELRLQARHAHHRGIRGALAVALALPELGVGRGHLGLESAARHELPRRLRLGVRGGPAEAREQGALPVVPAHVEAVLLQRAVRERRRPRGPARSGRRCGQRRWLCPGGSGCRRTATWRIRPSVPNEPLNSFAMS